MAAGADSSLILRARQKVGRGGSDERPIPLHFHLRLLCLGGGSLLALKGRAIQERAEDTETPVAGDPIRLSHGAPPLETEARAARAMAQLHRGR